MLVQLTWFTVSLIHRLLEVSNNLVSIGTPPQPVVLALDTGSSETWVNPTCATASTPNQVTECNNSPRYDPSKSSSYSEGYLDFSLSYGKGSAYGEYALDTITIGGIHDFVTLCLGTDLI
jgi:hypothetical protein